MANILPERGYVLIRQIDHDPLKMGKTKIIMPDTGKEEPQFGQVIAVGHPRIMDSGLEVGVAYETDDYCYFGKWQGLEFTIGGKKHKLVKQDQVHAVVELTEEEITSLTTK